MTVMASPLACLSGQKQLLEQLPSKLRVLLPEDVGGTVVSLWNVRELCSVHVLARYDKLLTSWKYTRLSPVSLQKTLARIHQNSDSILIIIWNILVTLSGVTPAEYVRGSSHK